MKKTLLVTLADKNYIDQAKQLFSSVYHNAGWKGDYMLLAHDIPESKLKWFEDKGILVKRCKALYNKNVGGMPVTLTSKFYLFTPEFKKWDNIVYMDADIIVKASLDKLTEVSGFAAVEDTIGANKFKFQIVKPENLESRGITDGQYFESKMRIRNQYGLDKRTFCAGMFAFSTELITEDTFDSLRDVAYNYKNVSAFGDQLIFNLFFFKKWMKLPAVYDAYFIENMKWDNLHGKAPVIHFIGNSKPWLKKNVFYREWKRNLEMADLIDLQKRSEGKKIKLVRLRSIHLKFLYKRNSYKISFNAKQRIYHNPMGRLGFFLRRHSPRLHMRLKSLKDGVHEKFVR